MIRPLLAYATDKADVDTKDEKKSRIDIYYPFINYYDVYLDNKHLLMGIYYPNSTI